VLLRLEQISRVALLQSVRLASRPLRSFNVPCERCAFHFDGNSVYLMRRGPYSWRSAIIGSARMARYAGIKQAKSATAHSKIDTLEKVSASVLVTPTSKLPKKRVQHKRGRQAQAHSRERLESCR
jgi:hypothetical protein